MKCPRCRIGATRVLESRHRRTCIVRSRRCRNCQHRFQTYESTQVPIGFSLPPPKAATPEQAEKRRVDKMRRMAREEAADSGKNYRELCAEYGVPLKHFDVSLDEQIHALRAEGLKLRQIAATLGCSSSHAHRVLKVAA